MARKTLKQQEYVFSSRTIMEAIQIFSAKAFEAFEPVHKQQVHGLLKQLYLALMMKNSVNIAELGFVASGKIVSNTVCSKNLFDNTKNKGRELKHTFWELMQILGSVNVTDLIPVFKPFDLQGLKRRILKIFWRLYAFYENIIKERLEERKIRIGNIGKEKLDLLDVLLDYRSDRDDELKSLSRKNIKGMLAEMFTGTETTSSTFEWGMAEIQRKPDAYKKIVMELDQVVGKDRFVEESDISNLPYLQAAVKEVFWLHPAVPLLVPHSTNEACEVSGYHIP
ncbi:3,9-dihydroxypterocarpan 6A-monooxygenase [Prunus persica]|uniref:3,9-dihydroxypterocarpan 6A-monooxygenase n=1 Tax=Prunus persica TaxID=3760 RepID=UPI0009AB4728|nr:3,9-dihydroxypterocarpan 6A-monooxygenase [Prunus persica]